MAQTRAFFAEDFSELEYKGSWVTDESVLRELENRYEQKSADGGLDFTYAVTIQNHMSYTEENTATTPAPRWRLPPSSRRRSRPR